jgi:hypothetical protein
MECGPEIRCTIPGQCTNSNRTVKNNIPVVPPSEVILSMSQGISDGKARWTAIIGNLFNECASRLSLEGIKMQDRGQHLHIALMIYLKAQMFRSNHI